MRLIGDIGGTNVRFAFVDDKGKISETKKFLKSDFENITKAVITYKSMISKNITEAVIAVNTPVIDNKPHAGSNDWGYKTATLERDTGIAKIVFINDLLAHASAIPHLTDDHIEKIYGGKKDKEGSVVIIGPGTGLGISYGCYNKDTTKMDYFPSEGGAELAAAADLKQQEIIKKMLKYQPYVRWEELTSGKGISNLYEALYDDKKTTEEIMSDFGKGSEKSREVFGIFCEFLGILARNFAATFLSTGGIYIIGGILNREENLEFFKKSRFIDYYSFTFSNNKSVFIKDYPIYVITHDNSALVGAANFEI
ncbi:MAG: glucokinase [Lactobacillaceae bacterium]|jgi:glucokinase|nr:glucokinase [Lactobacillaceae bacterium]